jgi:hypothetical protein
MQECWLHEESSRETFNYRESLSGNPWMKLNERSITAFSHGGVVEVQWQPLRTASVQTTACFRSVECGLER